MEWDSFFRHEIKAPLTPVLGLSRLLAEEDRGLDPETRQDYLRTIHDSAASLARVLEMTREAKAYEDGRIDLELRLFDLARTVRAGADQALREVESIPPRQDSRISFNVQPGLHTLVEHDPARMRRVFKNLVKNALEHDPGPVAINIFTPTEEPGVLAVSVMNRGEPIPAEILALIFEKFNTTKKTSGGTGLGTTIARLFTEAHGGRIRAASSPEGGTVFTVSLPIRPIRRIEPCSDCSSWMTTPEPWCSSRPCLRPRAGPWTRRRTGHPPWNWLKKTTTIWLCWT